ncbi:MAG: ParB/RepB/Spo0J family partition protein [Oscillospiraceae bacterium]|nr:ParB/RepB/Spo0J family partition protein [Oscillospiraceae bacterium]
MLEKVQTKVFLIDIEKIEPSPFQARTFFSEQDLINLQCSIQQNGLLQPVSVRKTENGKYQLIAGERRLRAMRQLGEKQIPAIICNLEDVKSATLGLLENLQRAELNCFEQAKAIKSLLLMWHCTQEEAALRLGMAQPTLANKLRILALNEEQQKICIEGGLTERHARAVLKLVKEDQRTLVLKQAAEKYLSVSQTEQLVENKMQEKTKKKPKTNVMVRDVRIFINTINKAVNIMKTAGVPAVASRTDTEEYIEYVVRIPTTTTPLQ